MIEGLVESEEKRSEGETQGRERNSWNTSQLQWEASQLLFSREHQSTLFFIHCHPGLL